MDVSKSQVVLLVTTTGAVPVTAICGSVELHTDMSGITGCGVLSAVTATDVVAVHPPVPDTVTIYVVDVFGVTTMLADV
jgi:hypothetical protein